ncbi:acriflavin resistance protein [Magnetococcus marinus MC-1]|uniref:Acriflavin resistance protein n=1 Tax=Magnetococcus marinus (strain ATCC BAA-1437 / JCM 17883 / MC-1) TaxID=156889 RepID=A0L8N2_MAGMM|nr:efflux RND transporter permease subunit [Magnetococcus marinus]ABK44325.1 acriflavin resistance protein [Magnetococcus marinus MC-1]
MSERLHISGRIAAMFQNSEITPLLALVGLLLGLFAVAITPQEEEPQISVTFVNIFIPFPGATAHEVEQLVAIPAEQVLSEVEGVKHVYAQSMPGQAVLTVRYRVGEDRNAAILRLYNAVFSNQDFLPANLGVGQPLVKPKGIDDVPIVTFSLWSQDENVGREELTRISHALEAELKRIPGTRDIYTVGASRRVVQVTLDPVRMAGHGFSITQLQASLSANNQVTRAQGMVADNHAIPVQIGNYLHSAEDVAGVVIGLREGSPVFLRDVADVAMGPQEPTRYVWYGSGPGASTQDRVAQAPSVTLAVAKKPGVNASDVAKRVIARMEHMRAFIIPQGVNFTVTRNYGHTAESKAHKLIGKLAFATFFVVLLVLLTMGWREAIIVGLAVILTLALTLFASWVWGFTLNRVSLFALIFSIGILVDDAIVVVENIHRHMHRQSRSLLEIIPRAVDEVGGPTILATFTVIAALLPMAFVTGLMGPYMSPIPINASTGMLISLLVAFVITPWLAYHGLRSVHAKQLIQTGATARHPATTPVVAHRGRLERLFGALYTPFLRDHGARRNYLLLGGGILLLIVGSLALIPAKQVVLKMLPFDNKSEFQVMVDLPEGTALEQTARLLDALGKQLAQVPEVANYQVYAGTAAPVGFNGLVRQYYLRQAPHLGEIQVNLVDKTQRQRKSHEVALAVRSALQTTAAPYAAVVKIVEVPPGPPVQAPLVAEIYGPSVEGRQKLAKKIEKLFNTTPDIVDVDSSIEAPALRYILHVDRQRASLLGVSQQSVAQALSMAIEGEDLSFIHTDSAKYPIPIRLHLPAADRAEMEALLGLQVPSSLGTLVTLSEVVTVQEGVYEKSIDHKDLIAHSTVTGDMAGTLDSPLYGMLTMVERLKQPNWDGENSPPIEQYFIHQPEDPFEYGIKWDGEWQITYETFRDMGIAYGVGLIMIYLLVVAQFKSYLTPLIIMAPIPLTVIGVMPGHALLGVQFTATSMIGMIALAGIIVRNSILLVDFINEQIQSGIPFKEAVIQAGSVRSKPIVLTGLAAMLGALFILDDPIFGGLAISLIFGILISTILTLWVIPILYYGLMRRKLMG